MDVDKEIVDVHEVPVQGIGIKRKHTMVEINKTTAIIQARMLSRRCPGKVMREVVGKPLIGHMLDRLRQSKHISDCVVATSVDSSNNPLCDYLEKNNFKVFRGSEDHVLERFYRAAKKFGGETLVRLTADCPLIDPAIVDEYIRTYFEKKVDFIHPHPSFAVGLDAEVFSFNALEEAYNNATLKSEKEHITQYFFNNPDRFNKTHLENSVDDSKYRITVDEEVDFLVVKQIFEALYTDENTVFGFDKIRQFLDEHEDVFNLNASIIRGEGLLISLEEDKKEAKKDRSGCEGKQ